MLSTPADRLAQETICHMSSIPESRSRRVYLDVCALCRPFDDQNQARIRLETTSVEIILDHVRRETIKLIISPAHEAEIGAIPEREERNQLLLLLRQLGTRWHFNLRAARQRAEELVAQGVGVADAAHLAFAEQSSAEFITVDDQLLRRCRRIKLSIWCGSPLAYCDKENLQ